MKHLKMCVLAAVVGGALMAIPGASTASANGVLCSTATNPCTSKWAVGTALDFSLESGTSTKVTDTSGNVLDTCTESTVKDKLTSNPAGTTTATGENTSITWGNCAWTTDTTKLGKLKFEAEDDSGNGWLYSDEQIRWTINIPIFGSCEYGVEAGTRLGTVKEGTSANATITINAVIVKLNACVGPSTSLLTASYVMTEPNTTTLFVSTS